MSLIDFFRNGGTRVSFSDRRTDEVFDQLILYAGGNDIVCQAMDNLCRQNPGTKTLKLPNLVAEIDAILERNSKFAQNAVTKAPQVV